MLSNDISPQFGVRAYSGVEISQKEELVTARNGPTNSVKVVVETIFCGVFGDECGSVSANECHETAFDQRDAQCHEPFTDGYWCLRYPTQQCGAYRKTNTVNAGR